MLLPNCTDCTMKTYIRLFTVLFLWIIDFIWRIQTDLIQLSSNNYELFSLFKRQQYSIPPFVAVSNLSCCAIAGTHVANALSQADKDWHLQIRAMLFIMTWLIYELPSTMTPLKGQLRKRSYSLLVSCTSIYQRAVLLITILSWSKNCPSTQKLLR